MATDDDIRDLLQTLTPSPEVSIDIDEIRRGSRRRASRVALAAAIAVVVVSGGIATATATLWGDNAAQSPVAPAPSAEGTPIAQDCLQPGPGAEIDPADTPDFVFVKDREFARLTEAGQLQLGGEVARVTCTVANQLREPGRSVPAFWPEGAAGLLPVGTPLLAVEGHDPRCRIAADVDGEARVYATALEAEGDCRPEAGTGCPESHLLPEGDFRFELREDIVHWGPYAYSGSLDAGRDSMDVPLGDQIGVVTCNLVALTAELERDREITGPLPSGTASYLPVGTKLYRVVDYPESCRIAAVVDGEIREYLPRDDQSAPNSCADAVRSQTSSSPS